MVTLWLTRENTPGLDDAVDYGLVVSREVTEEVPDRISPSLTIRGIQDTGATG